MGISFLYCAVYVILVPSRFPLRVSPLLAFSDKTSFERGCGLVALIHDSSNPGALGPGWDNVCCNPRARAPLGQDGAWLHGFGMAVIWEPWFQIGVMHIASQGLAHLSIARNASDIGTPRALPVFARGGWRGLSSKPDGPPDPSATENLS
jgi:hypothetical protein